MSLTVITPAQAEALTDSLHTDGLISTYDRIASVLERPTYKGKKNKVAVLTAIDTLLASNDLMLDIPTIATMSILDRDGNDLFAAPTPATEETPAPEASDTTDEPSNVDESAPAPRTPAVHPEHEKLAAKTIADAKKRGLTHEQIHEEAEATLSIDGISAEDAAFAETMLALLAAPKKNAAITAPKNPGQRRTPAALTDIIVLHQMTNPRRPGAAHDRVQAAFYRDPSAPTLRQTVAEAFSTGYHRGDLNWDLERGYITIEPAAPATDAE